MKKIIRLTEQDLEKIVKKVLIEQKEILNPKGLKFGDRGEDVKILQQKLMDKGLLKTNTMKPTGYFGPLTKNALESAEGVKPKTPSNTTPATNKKSNDYLLFDGNFLYFMVDGKVLKQWKAYSGRTKWNVFGDKNVTKLVDTIGQDKEQFMKVGNQGPIPSGNYSISQIQKRTKGDADALCTGKNFKQLLDLMMKSLKTHDWNTGTNGDLIAWGNFRCPITPIKGTNTYGRSSFYIHGGGIAGSIGCIDLLLNMTDFIRTFEEWKSRTKNNSLKLTVKY